MNAEIAADLERAKLRADAKGKTLNEADFTGVSFGAAEHYENAWLMLPK